MEGVFIRENDGNRGQQNGIIQNSLPITLPHLRQMSFVGMGRLKILDSLSFPHKHAVLEIGGINKLNIAAELSAASKRRLREACHTHLSISSRTIETSLPDCSGRYRFSGMLDQHVLPGALVSYGRAFGWSASITHLSLNSDGTMLHPSVSDPEIWRSELGVAWSKLLRSLTQLTYLKIVAFPVEDFLAALHPQIEARAGVSRMRVPCPRLDTIMLLSFLFETRTDTQVGSGSPASLAVHHVTSLFTTRKAAGNPINKLVLSSC